MEGATGITNNDQTGPEGKDYQRAREWLTSDVNAAAKGAMEAGAGEIIVADSHGNMRNILLEKLDPSVKLIAGCGLEREFVQLPGIDGSYGAVVLVGFHARAGTETGVMSHTWIGGIVRDISVNGRVLGETGLAAATAGKFGVPVVAVAGDRAVCEEAERDLPGVVTAEVKAGLGRGIAVCLHPQKSAEAIRSAARDGVLKAGKMPPFKVKEPCTVRVRFMRDIIAKQAAKSLRTEVVDGDGVEFSAPAVTDALKLAWRVAYVGSFDEQGLRTW